MRFFGPLILAPLFALAQTPDSSRPAALVRGVLLERDPQLSGGQFSIRAADNLVLRYLFDRKTYVERENQMIDMLRLNPGEKLEVISDVVAGASLRYARTVHVILDAPPPRPPSPGRLRPYRPSDDRSIPRGSLTYSGVVFRINPERVAVHTREGDQLLLVRKDTRFVEDGEIVEAASLKPNTRVFIRAGKDVYEQMEAYQIVWGKILNPR
jgi:hypothetical protein